MPPMDSTSRSGSSTSIISGISSTEISARRFTSRSRTVTDIIEDTFPVSLQLGIDRDGARAHRRHHPRRDRRGQPQLARSITSAASSAIAGISTPSYVTVSLLVLLLSSQLPPRADRRLGRRLQHQDHHPGRRARALSGGGAGPLHPIEHARRAFGRLRPHCPIEGANRSGGDRPPRDRGTRCCR